MGRRRKRFAIKGEAADWAQWQLEQLGEKPWIRAMLMCAPCGWVSTFLYKEGR
ncbi:hypothetical protein KAM339_021070 [Aeromonas caviae]|nr:hypothetical protein KAM339_021070 [Aeromonas caviae]